MKLPLQILIHPNSTQKVKELIDQGDRRFIDFKPMYNGLYATGYTDLGLQCFAVPFTEVVNALKMGSINFTFVSSSDALPISSLLIDYYSRESKDLS